MSNMSACMKDASETDVIPIDKTRNEPLKHPEYFYYEKRLQSYTNWQFGVCQACQHPCYLECRKCFAILRYCGEKHNCPDPDEICLKEDSSNQLCDTCEENLNMKQANDGYTS